MEMLNKQIETKQGNDELVGASSLGYDSQRGDDSDNKASNEPHVKRDILWAFTNADKMKEDHWNRLESRMLDIYQSHPGIRYILTSSIESRKFKFTCFQKEEELDKM